MSGLVKLFTCVIILVGIYFCSYQIQYFLGKLSTFISKKVGVYSVTKEYSIQRYVFLHRASPISKLYHWVNEQIIALNLKRVGVTPVGYISFWAIVSVITTAILTTFMGFSVGSFVFLFGIILSCMLILTRVFVAGKMEKREADIMDAIDLIIPEISSGVKVAIMQYVDNFAISLQSDFKSFVTNINDRGYSFEDAMFILSDNLGLIFRDFAQKAVFYDSVGESDMIDIFSDIIETNRLRRDLRYLNATAFNHLKVSFIASSGIVFAYAGFLLATDVFSRHFFLETTIGRILLVIILLIVFLVLSYITTIKSRAL